MNRLTIRLAVVGAIGVAIASGWATWIALETVGQEARARFEATAGLFAEALHSRMTTYEQGLVGGAGLIAAVESVDRAAWGRFVAGQQIHRRFPGIQAMGFAAWVPDAERDAFVARVRANDLASYDIRPPGRRPNHLPILFNEPYEGRNRTVIGFDMMSEAIRRAAISSAAETGQPAVSGKVVLAGESPDQRPPGFVFYVPAFGPDGGLRGMVFAPFRVHDLVTATLRDMGAPAIGLRLTDGAEVLFDSATANSARFAAEYPVEIGGRTWRATIFGGEAFVDRGDEARSWVVAGAGLLVTLALGGMAVALIRSRLAEARFRSYAALGSDWSWEQDANQRFTFLSSDAAAATSSPTRSPIGVSRRELFASDGDPTDQSALDDILARMDRREPLRDAEYRLVSQTGAPVTIRISAEPVFGIGGRFAGYRGVAKDVTADRLRERALVEARHAAETANQAKSRFLANMSHELRTPLNAIIGFAEVIERRLFGDKDPARYSGYAKDIRQSGEHLLGLVNDILDLAKVESGRLDMTLTEIAVQPVLEECAAAMRERAQARKVALMVDAMGAIHARADARCLRQIMLNLVSNAIKFTPAEGRVALSARAEGGMIAIIVTDSGIGIEPDALDRVFEPFVQANPMIATSHGGTGLGLAITKSLVEAMGGSIALESHVGQGTTVTVRLRRGGEP
jgi:signal transduction histidine kinase/CHASE1-domain containing sensor protein